MCEEAPAVIYCVGYILPIGCCAAGACMSCYGCYRYYYASRVRRLQGTRTGPRQIVLDQPKIKRDTLKTRITERFLGLLGSREDKSLDLELKDVSLKDLEENCPICLMDYEKDTSQIFIGLIKGCGHYFHFECIWEWLERKQTCPICREACDLAETDIWGLSLKQVLDFAKQEGGVGQAPGLSKEGSDEQSEHQFSAGRNVVHIHLEPKRSSNSLNSGEPPEGLVLNSPPQAFCGKVNPGFQSDTEGESTSQRFDVEESVMTSPEIIRT